MDGTTSVGIVANGATSRRSRLAVAEKRSTDCKVSTVCIAQEPLYIRSIQYHARSPRRFGRAQTGVELVLNTYDITAVGRTQHPRARYLLLLDAILTRVLKPER